MFVFPLMRRPRFRGQVAHGRILINPDSPPARVVFDHGRARARKIGPIENPRRHLGVYLIGENFNVHVISHVHQTQGICGGNHRLFRRVRPAREDRPAACEPGRGRRKPGTLVVFAPWRSDNSVCTSHRASDPVKSAKAPQIPAKRAGRTGLCPGSGSSEVEQASRSSNDESVALVRSANFCGVNASYCPTSAP